MSLRMRYGTLLECTVQELDGDLAHMNRLGDFLQSKNSVSCIHYDAFRDVNIPHVQSCVPTS